MEHTSIVPNGEVILSPSEAYLKIMIFRNELQEVCLDDIAFTFCDSIDPSSINLVSSAKKRLPAGDGVRSNYGMRGLKVNPFVFWCSAVILDELLVEFLCHPVEIGLVVSCR